MNMKTDQNVQNPNTMAGGSASGLARAVSSLPGMRDYTPESFNGARAASRKALSYMADRGFERVDTPVLEDAELFVRKGGGELIGLLYTFTDPGGNRVSLRPEFTSSVIRMFVETRGLDLPARWSYAGPVFRYDRDGGRCRQFTQVGAEVIGAPGVSVDTELIGTALGGLGRIGVAGAAARVSHIEAFARIFAAFDLSESARRFVAGNLGRMKRGLTDAARLSARARDAGLVGGAEQTDLNGAADEAGLRARLAAGNGGGLGPTGRRTPEEILARLDKKSRQPRDPAELDRAVELAARLVRLEGPPDETIQAAKKLADGAGAGPDALDPLSELVENLARSGVGRDAVMVDMGLARGIAYYTGAIFDLVADGSAGRLGGGGRYDGLVEALGGPDIPALGYAYDMEAVASVAATG